MASKKTDLIQGYSKGLDISPEGLRFYERKGIIHPSRDAASGYRYYGFSDTVAVTTCRKMRCYGYTVDEASDMLKNHTFKDQAESLKEHEASLKKKIEQQQLILMRMQETETVIEEALSHLEEPVFSEFPATSFLPTRIQQEAIRDRTLLKQINSWNKFQPFPEIVLLHQNNETVTGIAMNQKYQKLFDLPWQEEFKGGKCLSLSMIQTISNLENGNYLQKAEQIIGRRLNDHITILLTASMKNNEMEILCRLVIPE